MPFNVTPKLKIASGLRQKSRIFFRKTEIRLRKLSSKPGQQGICSEFRHVQHILSVQIILRIAGGGDISPYRELLSHPQIRVANRFLTDAEYREEVKKDFEINSSSGK